ncbi:hypothetical protein [Tenacibaculum sp. 190524A02b]|uniref:Uncharacterized protein n=1 Tax=Tenacibaculum vairaonense TaxID=3137860 RepID=A0ABM9PKE6_9FLAO
MKNQLLSLGKVLSKETQQSVKGGGAEGDVYCVTEDHENKRSTIKKGPCMDPNDITSYEIEL